MYIPYILTDCPQINCEAQGCCWDAEAKSFNGVSPPSRLGTSLAADPPQCFYQNNVGTSSRSNKALKVMERGFYSCPSLNLWISDNTFTVEMWIKLDRTGTKTVMGTDVKQYLAAEVSTALLYSMWLHTV